MERADLVVLPAGDNRGSFDDSDYGAPATASQGGKATIGSVVMLIKDVHMRKHLLIAVIIWKAFQARAQAVHRLCRNIRLIADGRWNSYKEPGRAS